MGFTPYVPPQAATPTGNPPGFTPYTPPQTQLPPAHPIADAARSIYSGIASPVLNMIARPGQAAVHLAGNQEGQSGDLPIGFGATAHINDPYEDIVSKEQTAKQTLTADAGRAAQTVALGLGPVTGGATFGAGAAVEQGKPLFPTFKGDNAIDKGVNLATDNALGSAVTGAAAGKVGEFATKAVGTGIKAAGTGLKTLGSGADALYSSAQKNIEHVLAPTTKVNKLATESLAPKAARQGLPISLTRSSLLSKLNESASTADDQITKAWTDLPHGSTVNVKPILDTLNTEMEGLKIKGAKGEVIPTEQQAYFNQLKSKTEELNKLADADGNADAAATRQYRQSLDASIAKNKLASFAFSPTDSSNLAGTKLAANSTREQIAKQLPGVGPANKNFHFFNGLADILDATITRKTGQGTPLGEKLAEGAAGAAGVVKAGLTGGLEYAVLAKIASKVVNSTAWNTASAAAKKSLADAIASHDGTALSNVLKTGFNLAGTGLEHVGNFIKGVPGALKDLPQQSIPGTSASEIIDTAKNAQPGFSMKPIYLHPEDQNALIKYVDGVRLQGKPEAPNMTEDDWTAAERILTKAGVSLDQPQAKLAQIAEELANGDRSSRMFAPTGRPFKNEATQRKGNQPRSTQLPRGR